MDARDKRQPPPAARRVSGQSPPLTAALLAAASLFAGGCGGCSEPTPPPGMAYVPAGEFVMGVSDGAWFEGPPHRVEVGAFFIDTHEVSNRQFAAFVEATGYETEAEQIGWASVFDREARGWRPVDGASWRQPEGPGSSVDNRLDHPVVHVSFADASAYARWAGKRLPSEVEWAWAARGGRTGARFPWGDERAPAGEHRANTWQGRFPDRDEVEDGYGSTAPVGSFRPNGYGLYDMGGNVWEWTGTWFAPYPGAGRAPAASREQTKERVIRGGSWLCSPEYCEGYRVAARQKTEPDSALNNLGFRCARDVE